MITIVVDDNIPLSPPIQATNTPEKSLEQAVCGLFLYIVATSEESTLEQQFPLSTSTRGIIGFIIMIYFRISQNFHLLVTMLYHLLLILKL